jgi:tetratricopeptide (TPR) repeat protein
MTRKIVRRAIEYYKRALAIAREIGDRRGEGIYLSNLGLAYADQGETHGGAISVESRVGQGTAFTISIPMK